MSDEKNQIQALSTELNESYRVPPSHIEAGSFVADEVNRLAGHPVLADSTDVVEYLQPLESIKMSERPEAQEVPVKTINLPSYARFQAMGDLVPIKIVHVERQFGQPIDASLFASIQINQTGYHYDFIREANNRTHIISSRGDGTIMSVRELEQANNGVMTAGSRVSWGSLSFRYQFDDKRMEIGYSASDQSAKLTVAESVDLVNMKELFDDNERKRKQKRQISWIRRAVGVVALTVTLSPGGLIDRALDPFVDNGEVVRHSIQLLHPAGENVSRLQVAGKSIEQTMDELQGHNYQAILDRASEYKKAHRDEFMKQDTISDVLTVMDSSNSKAELENQMEKVGMFYGYTFVVSDGVSLDQLRYTGGQVVEALTRLPKGLTAQANPDRITIATSSEVSRQMGEAAGGFYDHSEDNKTPGYSNIHIAAQLSADEVVHDAMRILPGNAGNGGTSVQSIFMHEFGHALDEGSNLGVTIKQELGDPPNQLVDTAERNIWDSAPAISNYSMTDSGENTAENLSGVLSDRSDGLQDPDNTRAFSSLANQGEIATLATLEAAYPGIANYLIAENTRLMHGQTLNHATTP